MICKGAYCWNPLKVNIEETPDEKETWSDIERVLNFLESRDDATAAQIGSIYHQFLSHHMHALTAAPAGGTGIAGVAGVVAGSASIHPIALPAPVVAHLPGGASLVPTVQLVH